MQLNKTEGTIENLRITPCKQNILYAPHMEEAAGVSAIVFALAGMAGAAAQTAVNVDAGSDDVEVYRFTLNGQEYAGVTRRASFKNGDQVEVVYQEKLGGLEVLGVRRPDTRSIWLYPYMSCGSRAAIHRGFSLWLKAGIGSFLFIYSIILLANLIDGEYGTDTYEFFLILSLTFILVLLGVSCFLPKLFKFSQSAELVFKTFGFENPTMVNLHKTSKQHRKRHNIVWNSNNNLELWY